LKHLRSLSSPSLFDRYVAAWNAGDLHAWLDAHHEEVDYVSLAGPEPRTFEGHDGLREVWAESRANWHRFQLSVVDDDGDAIEVTFSGMELEQGIELSGVLWFSVESRDGKISRVRSAIDASLL
jgi:ketosteroid isomerase-like protein